MITIYRANTRAALRAIIGECSGLLIIRCKRHRVWIASRSITGTTSNKLTRYDQCSGCKKETE